MSEKLYVHENGVCWVNTDKVLMENPYPLLASFASTVGRAGMGGQETEGKTTLRKGPRAEMGPRPIPATLCSLAVRS